MGHRKDWSPWRWKSLGTLWENCLKKKKKHLQLVNLVQVSKAVNQCESMWHHTDAPRFAYHVWRRFLTTSGIDAGFAHVTSTTCFDSTCEGLLKLSEAVLRSLHRESFFTLWNLLELMEHVLNLKFVWHSHYFTLLYVFRMDSLWILYGFSMTLWYMVLTCFDSTTTTGSLGPGEWCVRTEVWWLGSQTGRDPPTEDSRCLTVIHRQPQLTSMRFCWFFMLDPIEQRWTACRTRSVTTDHFKKKHKVNTKWTESEHKVNRNSTRDDHRVTPSFPVSFSPSTSVHVDAATPAGRRGSCGAWRSPRSGASLWSPLGSLSQSRCHPSKSDRSVSEAEKIWKTALTTTLKHYT